MRRHTKRLLTDSGAKITIRKNVSGTEIIATRFEKDEALSEAIGKDYFDVNTAEEVFRSSTAGRYSPTLKEVVEYVQKKIDTSVEWKYA